MIWEVWSRYKKLNGTKFTGTREKCETFIEREAADLGYPLGAYFIQAETDQILSWTIDGSGRKRMFISMNTR